MSVRLAFYATRNAITSVQQVAIEPIPRLGLPVLWSLIYAEPHRHDSPACRQRGPVRLVLRRQSPISTARRGGSGQKPTLQAEAARASTSRSLWAALGNLLLIGRRRPSGAASTRLPKLDRRALSVAGRGARKGDVLADLPGCPCAAGCRERSRQREGGEQGANGAARLLRAGLSFPDRRLSLGSSRRVIYDVQVETLFYGVGECYAPRRRCRQSPPRSPAAISGGLALLDIACGTGRLLRADQARVAGFATTVAGSICRPPTLNGSAPPSAATCVPASLLEGNAEAIPLPDASQDIVTCVFLFHELPPRSAPPRRVPRSRAC